MSHHTFFWHICVSRPHLLKFSLSIENFCCYFETEFFKLITKLGKDTCGNDNGGPMVGLAATGQSYELIGITSFGSGCANAAYPGNICAYLAYPK
jgi:secreted trypsin-like serine protease